MCHIFVRGPCGSADTAWSLCGKIVYWRLFRIPYLGHRSIQVHASFKLFVIIMTFYVYFFSIERIDFHYHSTGMFQMSNDTEFVITMTFFISVYMIWVHIMPIRHYFPMVSVS
jgi:hypothetical protein